MTDFGIEPPSVSIATARDEVHIQLVLLALELAPLALRLPPAWRSMAYADRKLPKQPEGNRDS